MMVFPKFCPGIHCGKVQMNRIAIINSDGIVTACSDIGFLGIMVELIICVRNQPPVPAQAGTHLSLHGTSEHHAGDGLRTLLVQTGLIILCLEF